MSAELQAADNFNWRVTLSCQHVTVPDCKEKTIWEQLWERKNLLKEQIWSSEFMTKIIIIAPENKCQWSKAPAEQNYLTAASLGESLVCRVAIFPDFASWHTSLRWPGHILAGSRHWMSQRMSKKLPFGSVLPVFPKQPEQPARPWPLRPTLRASSWCWPALFHDGRLWVTVICRNIPLPINPVAWAPQIF